MLRRLLPLVLLLALLAPGCGGTDAIQQRADQIQQDVQNRIDRAQQQFEQRRERFGKRIQQVLADLQKQFPRPQQTSPAVRSNGNTKATTIDRFLTSVLTNIDAYWTKTLTANGLPQPRVAYDWVAPGAQVQTGCGAPADDNAAFYCPNDDTIYVAQVFAAKLYQGVDDALPGERAGYGHAAGDFSVAYVLAHEYAHDIQQELGVFDNRQTTTAEPFELQADCMAGLWAYSVYAAGKLQPGDIEEATNTALAVGDFDYGNAQHHGTPQQRRDAFLTGFKSGQPTVCERYLPT